MKSDEWKIIAT